MSNCKKYSLMIEDYIDGALDEKSREKLENHLSSCESCQRELRLSLKLREMTLASAETPSEHLHNNIMQSLNKQKPHSARKSLKFAALCAACVVICLCCAVVITIMPGRQKAEENTPTDIQTSYASSFEGTAPADEEMATPEPTIPNIEITIEEEIQDAVQECPDVMVTMNQDNEHGEEKVEAEVDSAAEVDSVAATDRPVTEHLTPAPEENPEKAETIQQESQTNSAFASGETMKNQKPGGDEITLALLIVSGLLAIASFVAFLISLSSVRQTSSKKE